MNSKSLKQGKLIHQKVVTLGLQNDIFLCKNLINLYLSCHLYDHAKCVFDNMENPCEISLWNGLMAGYTKNYMYVEALELFEKLLHYPYLKPDSYTYPSVFKACGGLHRYVLGKMIHTCLIKTGLMMDIVVGSSLVGDTFNRCSSSYSTVCCGCLSLHSVPSWLSGIPQTSDCANTLTTINATNPKEFQTQLINQDAHQINPSEVKASEPEAIENPSN
ncbi:Pentatricopeptide repeat-containing protein [Glycine soja]|uniref:Pentatricopeptide repeat-containing protein n=1 Tax=Glycine soja TaxID=3848 RepID=A0A0B2REB6_GLYSO|nr:Pentatricopeptide repeat-containing protein [Glycine soja]